MLALRGLVGKAFGAESVRPAARPALLCRRFGHGARLSLPVGRAAVSRTATRPAARRSAPGSIELRQRILEHYGVVGFVDAGQVTANGAPFTCNWRVGAGIGARYYTSIGPIRLDVAVPLNRQPHGDAFELYIGIGQAF